MPLFYTSQSLRQIKKGSKTTWRGVLKYKDGDTWKQLTKTFDSCKTKTEAKQALTEWHAQMEELHSTTPDESSTTVAEYIDQYIGTVERLKTVEPSTVHDYRSTSANIKLGLGQKRLCGLTPKDIQNWEIEMIEDGFAPATVCKAHRLLKMVLKHAVDTGRLPKNPMSSVKPPKRKKADPNALDKLGRDKLRHILASMDLGALQTAAYIALYTGMRRGEICALRWKDVDFVARTITVTQAVGYAEGGEYLKDPKSSRSRDIPIPSGLESILQRRRSAMLEQCALAGIRYDTNLYVLGEIDGRRKSIATLTKEWGLLSSSFNLIGTKGRKVTFHDLRHTFATLAISEGVDVRTVSSILGHASAAMTLDVYCSADPNAKRLAAETIDKALGYTA